MLWTLKVIVTKSASAALTLHLTSADTGNTYSVRPGDRVVVALNAVAKYTWSEPNVTKSTVVRRISARAGASAHALFVARASGRTMLVATQKPTCATGCSARTRRFWLNVVVTS
jgi:hypothetical protein